MKHLVLFLCFILSSLSLFGHDHYHGGGAWHPSERVYPGHPWYHHDHVVFYNGGCYPMYYCGYPYYYYTPQYYYDPNPTINFNVNIGG